MSPITEKELVESYLEANLPRKLVFPPSSTVIHALQVFKKFLMNKYGKLGKHHSYIGYKGGGRPFQQLRG